MSITAARRSPVSQRTGQLYLLTAARLTNLVPPLRNGFAAGKKAGGGTLTAPRSIVRRSVVYITVCGVLLLEPATGHSQLGHSWNTTHGDWSTSTNWLPTDVPAANDAAHIGNLPVAQDATVTLDQNDTVAEVLITNGMSLSLSLSFTITRGSS